MVDHQQKKIKKKTLKQSPKKQNLDQNISDSKSHICNSFFENIFSTQSSGNHQIFLFQNLQQKISKSIKTSEKDHSFYRQFHSKNHTHFTNLNSFKTENNMLPKRSQRNFFSLQIFQQTCFCLLSEKNICTAPFPDAQELLS